MPWPPRPVSRRSGAWAPSASAIRCAVSRSAPEISGWRCSVWRRAVSSATSELVRVMGRSCRSKRKRKGPRGGAALLVAAMCGVSDAVFDPALQRGLGGGAGLVRDDLAVLEDEQRRDAADAQLHGGVGVGIHVHLGDLHLAVHLGGDLFERGADLLARAAPFGPKIHHDGDIGILHLGIEGVIGYGDGGHRLTPCVWNLEGTYVAPPPASSCPARSRASVTMACGSGMSVAVCVHRRAVSISRPG